MRQHINNLQDIIRKIVRQVMHWYEPHFGRITMTFDTSGNPAELIGSDGIICYRKEGGSCVELGSGSGDSLWAQQDIDGNAGIIPKSARHGIFENCWLEDQGSGVDSYIIFWAVYGGGAGGHPHIIVE